MGKKSGILAMGGGKLHEVDGVVFDADSYARYLQHCKEEPAVLPSDEPAEPADAAKKSAETTAAAETPAETAPTPAETAPTPAPVFYSEPKHVGWYAPSEDTPRIPMMSGAVPPSIEESVPAPTPAYFIAPVRTIEEIRVPVGAVRRIVYGGGSGSGSYVTSFTTSFVTSYRYGSGSGSFFSSGSCIFAVGGYGLELI